MPKAYCVYMLASARNGTLYIGTTSDLIQRMHQHKTEAVDGFTKQYGVHLLVWFEQHDSAASMVTRERQLKEWKRAWKVELIEQGIRCGGISMATFLVARSSGPRRSPG